MSSFIIYLITQSKINPLPAHYYCKRCGHFEMPDTKLFGIDLERKKCPSCGETIYPDGFNLPIENVFGTNGKPNRDLNFSYFVSFDFYMITKELLEEMFPGYAIEYSYLFGERPSEFILFRKGKDKNDYREHIVELPNGEICVSRSIHREPEWDDFCMIQIDNTDPKVNAINEFQIITDFYVKDIPLHDILNVTWKDIYDEQHMMGDECEEKIDPDFKTMAKKCGLVLSRTYPIAILLENLILLYMKKQDRMAYGKIMCIIYE